MAKAAILWRSPRFNSAGSRILPPGPEVPSGEPDPTRLVAVTIRSRPRRSPAARELSHLEFRRRVLEHSRIYYFSNGGAEECYLGSADLMPRNLNRRVEVLFPVLRPGLVRMLRNEVLHAYMEDRTNSRRMSKDGSYAPKSGNAGGVDSQARFLTERASRQS